jgi:hypothetical protein
VATKFTSPSTTTHVDVDLVVVDDLDVNGDDDWL